MRRTLAVATVLVATVAIGVAPAAAGSPSPSDVADAGTIVESDLPAGWLIDTSDGDFDQQLVKQAKKIKDCKDYVAIRKSMDKATDAESPDFQSAAEQISNHVYVMKKEAAAEKIIKRAEAKNMADCFTQLFTRVFGLQFDDDPRIDDYRVEIRGVPGLSDIVGDEAVGYSGGVEVLGTDGTVDQLVVSTLLVRVGPAVISYNYATLPNQNTGAFDTALENSVLRTQVALA